MFIAPSLKMSISENPRIVSSAAPNPITFAASSQQFQTSGERPHVNYSVLPSDTLVSLHCIPEELLRRQRRVFANKVVLCFEEEFSTSRAKDWLHSYNQSSITRRIAISLAPFSLHHVGWELTLFPGPCLLKFRRCHR